MKALTAARLRLILGLSLALVSVAGTVLFAFGYKQLQLAAVDTNNSTTQAALSNSSLDNLMATQQLLASQSDAVSRASQMVAESRSYLYQDQIVNDMNAYANNAGVTIESITFGSPTGTVTSPASPSATSSAPTISGLHSTLATISLVSPVSYSNLLTFVYNINQNLTKMRIDQLDISRATGNGVPAGSVTVNAFNVEVYIR